MAKVAVRRQAKTASGHVSVRMYRQGLGDCFLLRFPKSDGIATFNMLIDCGLIAVATNPHQTMQTVVADIATTCRNHLDLVVMTHEHWDHASGFSTQQAQDAFDTIEIDEVWYAWTEDPTNDLGTRLRKERAAKVKALHAAAIALRASGSPLALERAMRVESLLQFFGVSSKGDFDALGTAGAEGAIGKTRAAFDYLSQRHGVRVRYRYPTKPPVDLPGVDGVRVYVLGPPEDEGRIKRSSPTKTGKEVYEFASDFALDDNLAAAFTRLFAASASAEGTDCPFEASLSIGPGSGSRPVPAKLQKLLDETWDQAGEEWRRIDLDWTAAVETLALNLDKNTNNTSLALAFELGQNGPVLLFAADAQVGNWLSWQDTKWSVNDEDGSRTVTGPELLQRTVFYKVGHHGSHNATLRAMGLEQMTSEDLVAFVPVFKDQAVKNRWMAMPFDPLVKRLEEKTGGRVVFSDAARPPPDANGLSRLSAAQRKAFLDSLTVNPLFYEYAIAMPAVPPVDGSLKHGMGENVRGPFTRTTARADAVDQRRIFGPVNDAPIFIDTNVSLRSDLSHGRPISPDIQDRRNPPRSDIAMRSGS
jgi:hypothetical protein